jgi:hypothetical protein
MKKTRCSSLVKKPLLSRKNIFLNIFLYGVIFKLKYLMGAEIMGGL